MMKNNQIMKNILYVFMAMLIFSACDDYSYSIAEDYEKADISAIECYNEDGERADETTSIATPTRMVVATLKKGENIKKLKVCLTISSGSTINPSLSVGYQDFSDPKVYKVTSPGGTIEKEWTIMIFETR